MFTHLSPGAWRGFIRFITEPLARVSEDTSDTVCDRSKLALVWPNADVAAVTRSAT